MGRSSFFDRKKAADFAKSKHLPPSSTAEQDGFAVFDDLLDAKCLERFRGTRAEIELLKNSEKNW
jgi:hypothetical protein